MILKPHIIEVIANENALYKRNELKNKVLCRDNILNVAYSQVKQHLQQVTIYLKIDLTM